MQTNRPVIANLVMTLFQSLARRDPYCREIVRWWFRLKGLDTMWHDHFNPQEPTMPFVTLIVGLLMAQAAIEPPSSKADVELPHTSQQPASLSNAKAVASEAESPTAEIAVPEEQSISKLVAELTAGTADQRRAAEQQIVARGRSALSHLPEVNGDTSEQARIRLERIRQAILDGDVDRDNQPKLYSLVGKMTVQTAFKSLQKQAGLPTTLLEDYESELSVEQKAYNVKRRPFWEAMESVLDGANVMLDPYSGDSRLFALAPDERKGTGADRLVSTDGPFRFELSRIEAVQDFRNQEDRILRLIAMVFWEPGTVPVTLRHDIEKLVVNPGKGALKLLNEQTPRQIAVRESLAFVELQFPFDLPSRDVKQIELLAGSITATIPAKKHQFKFVKLGGIEPIKQSNGGVDVTIERARTVQNLHDIRVLVKVPSVNEQSRGQVSWVYNNVAYLRGPDGKRHEDVLTEIYQQSEGEIGLLYKYDAAGDIADYSFHYETPAGFRSLSADYSFTDIELP